MNEIPSENYIKNKRTPTYLQASIPFFAMLAFILFGYVLNGLRIEVMLILSTFVAGFIAKKLGYSWGEMEEEISKRLKKITPAVLIMWSVGIVIGCLMFSGTIPMIIYYGLKIIDADYLLVFTFIICLILATATGTAWGATGTAGVAMIGLGIGFGVPIPMVAGAAISGAIFGDKMSPLSDTTNLAPAATGGVTLFEHIRYMWFTTIPAVVISLVVFYIMGGLVETDNAASGIEQITSMSQSLETIFDFQGFRTILMLIPLIIILGGAAAKKPTVPMMLFGSGIAVIVGVICNGFSFQAGCESAILGFSAVCAGIDPTMLDANVVTLVTRGGAFGMIGIIVIIYSGYAFTAVWSMTGGIQLMFRPIIQRVRSAQTAMLGALVVTGLLGCVCGTSYVPSIIVPELFREKFLRLGLHPKNLSRILEDAGTCLNPLWPWSMSGIFYATTFGIPTKDYIPFSVLCYVTPIISLCYAITQFKVEKIKEQ